MLKGPSIGLPFGLPNLIGSLLDHLRQVHHPRLKAAGFRDMRQ
jgi:hypothetical protein